VRVFAHRLPSAKVHRDPLELPEHPDRTEACEIEGSVIGGTRRILQVGRSLGKQVACRFAQSGCSKRRSQEFTILSKARLLIKQRYEAPVAVHFFQWKPGLGSTNI
jgi:hypothetical protein